MVDDEIKDYELDEDALESESGYRVKLDRFEGPLDLLLHLIKRAKIRICDIFISDITRQFLEFIEEDIDNVDLDKASEFLGMAAYLLEIKAKALLPKPEVQKEDADEDDGSELIRRLEEYELYKKEMDKLKELETVGVRFRDPDITVGDERTVLKDMTMEGLFAALKKLYEKAENIYGARLDENDARRAGLYNNHALALVDLKRYKEAENLYKRALAVMEKAEHGQADAAVTYVNMAHLYETWQNDEEKISACMEKAEELLNTPSLPRNGYYAFVCSKCAPSFGYFGYFLVDEELQKRAKEIYERA